MHWTQLLEHRAHDTGHRAVVLWSSFSTQTNEPRTSRFLTKLCKFDPEGIRGPIGPEVVVLEPWQPGHHASTKKFVDVTSSVFDLFSVQYPNFDKCLVIVTQKCLVILVIDIEA